MTEVVYSGRFSMVPGQGLYQTYPAVCVDHYYQKDEFCGDFHVCDNGRKGAILSFVLRNPKGNENYKLEVTSYYHKEPVIVYQPVFVDVSGPVGYNLKCTVTYHSNDNAVISRFVSYSKADPEQGMTFKCAEEEIKAVASLMCSVSPVIDAMMKSDCIEAKTKTVKIEDFSANVIRKMVEFCETNKIQDTNNVELELCKVADKYDMDLLKDYISPIVVKDVVVENVIELFQFAHTYRNDYIKKQCAMCDDYSLIECAKSADYTKIDANVLKEFWIAIKDNY